MTDTWLPLKPILTRWGHLVVNLHREGRKFRRYIHRLVLEAFVGPRPPGLICCHWDGDPANNRLENLRWDTYKSMSPDDLLGQMTIPTPCAANWDEMEGDQRSRFCRDCGKTVFDLKEMSQVEVVSLWEECEHDFCGRITRRTDGKVVTRSTLSLGPFRFTIRSMLALVAYLAAMLGFLRFISTSSVTAGAIRIRPTAAPGASTTGAAGGGVTCEDFSSAQDGPEAPADH